MLFVEMPSVRAVVEDRAALRTGGWETEIHPYQLNAVAGSAHHRRHVIDPDIVAFRQIQFGLLRRDAKLEGLHHLDVFNPFHMLFVSVAHAGHSIAKCK